MNKLMPVQETKAQFLKFRLTPTLDKALQRFATANALTKSSAASMLIIQRLKAEKYIK
jgi:hypothetical protein